MSQNSTLLIEINTKGEIEIIDLDELINLDYYLTNLISKAENLGLQASEKTISNILKEI